MAFQLGVQAKDKITGFEGTITGKAEYLTGCDQYLVMPKSKDNKPAEGQWFDEHRLEVTVNIPITLTPPVTARPLAAVGADMAAPIK